MHSFGREKVGDIVSRCAELAALLEVSASPKPGNVHRFRDFTDTRYEHFLAGSVAMGPVMNEIAKRGYDLRKNEEWTELGIGDFILRGINDVKNWQGGGNINLGIILLFSPIAAAAGYTLKKEYIESVELREVIPKIIDATTPRDSVSVYDAIRITMSDEHLGDVNELDVKDKSSKSDLIDKNLNLLDVFRLCADRDSICEEWVSNFDITFTQGYNYLKRRLEELEDINFAIIDAFLYILSKNPDSLITRKSGYKKSLEVSKEAAKILSLGGASSRMGGKMLREMDEKLHESSGKLNPGTTADLTASAIFVLLLEGWRP